MKARSVIVFFMSLNMAAYILGLLAASGTITGLDVLGAPTFTAQEITDKFNIVTFSAQNIAIGVVGAGIVGLIGWITKQGVYAIYAAVIWLVGIFLNIFQFVLTGLSALVGILLPPEVAFMGGVIYAFVMITFFYALSSMVGQRSE